MTIWSRIGTVGDGGYEGLIIGAILSGVLLEIWLYLLDRIRDPKDLETWQTELAWLSGGAVFAFMGYPSAQR